MIYDQILKHLLSIICPFLLSGWVMGQGVNIVTMSSDPDTGNLVFDLKAPISLSLSSGKPGHSAIGFVLREVYSEAKGPAVEVFTGVDASKSSLRVYIPSQGLVGSVSYGTWGTRANTGGTINSRDFFGSVSLDGADDLSAGDQIVLLPGKVTLSHSATTLLPETLNNSTQIQFFEPLDSSALSVAAGLGASSTPLPETKMGAPVLTPTGVELSWTGPGLLTASPDLGANPLWDFTQNPNDSIKPPAFIFFRDLPGDSRDRYFFQMAMPWNMSGLGD
jgi:hypothetical protein